MAEIEHLNKQQIVLLVLLVAIITAITTGIVTVSITDQQDPGVVNTVNRVVEKTIERVISPATTTTIVKQTEERTTIYVGIEEQLAKSTEKALESIVRIKKIGTSKNTEFVGLGLVISKNGLIVSDKSQIVPGGTYLAEYLSIGTTTYPLKIESISSSNDLIYLSPSEPNSIKSINFTPIRIADINSIKIGQTVFSISGEKNSSLYSGVIQSVSTETKDIFTNIDERKTLLGSALFNIGGEVVGIKTNSLALLEGNTFMLASEINLQVGSTTQNTSR